MQQEISFTDWKPLYKSRNPIKYEIQIDDVTRKVIEPFDYQFNGEITFYPYEIPEELPKEFNIGIIVGPSGSGKSTLLKNFGQNNEIFWKEDLSIASHFDNDLQASEKLAAAGLMSIPDYVKPFSILSNGQKFRANLARNLKDNAVIDEFTSVVDRNIAKAASSSVSKYIRRKNVKNVVFASVHSDILEFLQPDWIIDTGKGEWTSGRYLQRPKLDIKIYPAKDTIWKYFSENHYLSSNLNKASHSYIALWENQLVGFISVISYPSGTVKNAWREHRLVVNPDYQGLGFGPKISEAVAQHYLDNNKRYFSKTSHPRLGIYRDNSKKWKPTSKNHMRRTDGLKLRNNLKWQLNPFRWSYSHEYVGFDQHTE